MGGWWYKLCWGICVGLILKWIFWCSGLFFFRGVLVICCIMIVLVWLFGYFGVLFGVIWYLCRLFGGIRSNFCWWAVGLIELMKVFLIDKKLGVRLLLFYFWFMCCICGLLYCMVCYLGKYLRWGVVIFND